MRRPGLMLSLALVALASFVPMIVEAENGDGVISGTVRLVGPAPSIPTIQPEGDFDACG